MGVFTQRFTDEQEKAILSLYFTNPHGDVSFVIPNRDLGPEEAAALAAQYSRSGESFQQRFLRLVEKEENLDVEFINALVADPSLANKGSLIGAAAKKSTMKFHTRWSLGLTEDDKDTALRSFGDDSIKDGANVTYHTENITDHDNKIITQNPRNRPQVKSSRYQEWDGEVVRKFVRENPDIQNSSYAGRMIAFSDELISAYERFTGSLADFVEKHPLNQEFREHYTSQEAVEKEVMKTIELRKKRDSKFTYTDEDLAKLRGEVKSKRENNYPTYARKSVVDSVRYLLFPACPTNMAVVSDARTLEEDLTNLLSSPLESAVMLGSKLMEEGRKIMPTLLGANTHARKSEFQIELRETLMQFVKDKELSFSERAEGRRVKSFVNGIEAVEYLSLSRHNVKMFSDAQLASTLVFPYSHGSLEQIASHFLSYPKDVEEVRDILKNLMYKQVNGKEVNQYEPLPPELLHGGMIKEVLVDWGAYRDVQRHRRGFKSRQLLSTYHGFETPKLIELSLIHI